MTPAAVPSSRRRRTYAAGGLALAAAAILGVTVGPVRISAWTALTELADRLLPWEISSGLSDQEAAIVWHLRAPRVVLGAMVGAMLAAAGGAYQGVFRNPLADPYLLGVAAGAGLGATAALAAGLGAGVVPVAAFVGAVLAVAATYHFARAAGGRRTPATLILAGVAIGSFLTALQTFLQQQSSDRIREVFTWILGRLSGATWPQVTAVLPYVAVSLVTLVVYRRILDVLSVGEEEAATLGVRPARARMVIIGAATLGSAAVVSVSGLIGFVGIVVPHAIRLVAGPSYRRILPLSMLVGAAFLLAADLLARTIISPGELPIGVVTAFVGAPFFAMILRRRVVR
ncbi:MAG: iron ABC transporter permease [Acidimicrobiia bacterium]|nr:iron ABC transporter permease [Acidimicrobiia bacterium]